MKPKLSQARRLGFSLFFYLTAFVVGQVIFMAMLSSFGIEPTGNDDGWYIFSISSLPNYLIGVPLFFFLTRSIPSKPVPKQRHLTISEIIKYLIMSQAIGYLFSIVANLINDPLVRNFDISENIIEDLIQNMELLPIIVFVVIVGPIMEELVFRKRFLDKAHAFGRKKAVLAGGLAFGLFHMNVQQGIYTFAIGIFWSILYFKTGRLSLVIILHMLMNFLGSVVMVQVMKSTNPSMEMISGVVVIMIIVFGVMLLFKERKELMKALEDPVEYQEIDGEQVPVKKVKKTPSLIGNIGYLAYVLLCVLFIIGTMFMSNLSL